MKLLNNSASHLRNALLACGLMTAMGVTPSFAQPSYTDTLFHLAGTPGATLSIGDKTFSGFSYHAVGLTSFDANLITVTASQSGGVHYLTWSGNMSLASGGFATADLLLNYTVTANPGLISMIDQRYMGSVLSGSILINETATSAGAPTATSQLSVGDTSDGPFDIGENDILFITPPQSTLYVTKDLSFVVLGSPAAPGSVTVDMVQQSFHQVPEPSAMALGGLGGVLFLLKSRRQSKRD